MSGGDDWQVGDLALCVRRPERASNLTRPGAIYTVAAVGAYDRLPVLALSEVPNKGPDWCLHRACRFVRIPPLTGEERAEFLHELDEPEKQPGRVG